MKFIIKVISGVLMFVGFLFVWGSAGALEHNIITFPDLVTRAVIGIATCGVGLIIAKTIEKEW